MVLPTDRRLAAEHQGETPDRLSTDTSPTEHRRHKRLRVFWCSADTVVETFIQWKLTRMQTAKKKPKKHLNQKSTAWKQGHKAPDWLCSYFNWQLNRAKYLYATLHSLPRRHENSGLFSMSYHVSPGDGGTIFKERWGGGYSDGVFDFLCWIIH